jgi:hypothetical protein
VKMRCGSGERAMLRWCVQNPKIWDSLRYIQNTERRGTPISLIHTVKCHLDRVRSNVPCIENASSSHRDGIGEDIWVSYLKTRSVPPSFVSEITFRMKYSVETDATPAFAWRFRTDVANWSDPPPGLPWTVRSKMAHAEQLYCRGKRLYLGESRTSYQVSHSQL